MKLINFKVFILSFLVGIMWIYFSAPEAKKVTVYTTADNSHLFQFNDNINNCFQLKRHVVKCSNDSEEIPLQV